MKLPCAFNHHNHIFDRLLVDFTIDCRNGRFEALGVMLQHDWSNERVTIKVAHHPLGPRFGGIDGDDGEVLRPDGLDAGVDDAVGLVEKRGGGTGASRAGPGLRGC